jgi:hypothetical protein
MLRYTWCTWCSSTQSMFLYLTAFPVSPRGLNVVFVICNSNTLKKAIYIKARVISISLHYQNTSIRATTVYVFVVFSTAVSLKCWPTCPLTIHTSPRHHPTAITVWGGHDTTRCIYACRLCKVLSRQWSRLSILTQPRDRVSSILNVKILTICVCVSASPDSITISGMNKLNRTARFTDERVVVPRQLFVS